ncbi:MAG: PQQ-binding-like beta-propeller repeat protein [Flavobacteriales bacterium]|nr:PQQ-binding-like beta-propeller repeat protein [Flavobacteriales bacterium]
MKRIFLLLLLSFCAISSYGQNQKKLTFALVADTHISGDAPSEDLIKTVNDINSLPDVEFVIVAGDITEFGADWELQAAHTILSKLKKPYYIVPGNHDAKWSESGCNTFAQVFGGTDFAFYKYGILFCGTASGPNMRMGMAQVPRESLVWLDSLITATPKEVPIIYTNHNPMDASLANVDQTFDILKKGNLVLTLSGHWHVDTFSHFDGVPNIIGRSNLRSTTDYGGAGYNLITIDLNTMQLTATDRLSGVSNGKTWVNTTLKPFDKNIKTSRPDYSLNEKYTNASTVWEKQENSDIGSGFAYDGTRLFYATASGVVKGMNAKDGKELWQYKTAGRIYSFPAYSQGRVVCPSTDGNIYCLNAKNGRLLWVYPTKKAIVACPLIADGVVYVGSSAGEFYAIDLKTGTTKWVYKDIKGFIEARAVADVDKVYIGSWGNEFYALSRADGHLVWKWNNKGSRMLSAAACFPVLYTDRVFITTPERATRALNKATGKEIWYSKEPNGRESQGISLDGRTLYIKTMFGNKLVGIDSSEGTCKIKWSCALPNDRDMDLAPAPIESNSNAIFVPSSIGNVYAVSSDGSHVIWAKKLSNTVINHIIPLNENTVVASTMDGKIICIRYTLE